jgi:hypothetical protein
LELLLLVDWALVEMLEALPQLQLEALAAL